MKKINWLILLYLIILSQNSNIIIGRNNYIVGKLNRVQGHNNYQLTYNVHSTGQNNCLVGANYQIQGNNIRMFGTDANQHFFRDRYKQNNDQKLVKKQESFFHNPKDIQKINDWDFNQKENYHKELISNNTNSLKKFQINQQVNKNSQDFNLDISEPGQPLLGKKNRNNHQNKQEKYQELNFNSSQSLTQSADIENNSNTEERQNKTQSQSNFKKKNNNFHQKKNKEQQLKKVIFKVNKVQQTKNQKELDYQMKNFKQQAEKKQNHCNCKQCHSQ